MNVHGTITGGPELIAKFKEMEDRVAVEALVDAATAGALIIQNAAKKNAPRKTRNLSRSIHTEVAFASRDQAEVTVGTDVEYAAIQEFGGTITAKNGKYLAIPVNETAQMYKPMDFPGKLHFQGDNSGGVLMNAEGEVFYALKPSVTIPAHPYLRPALDENIDRAVESAGRALKKIINKIAGGGE